LYENAAGNNEWLQYGLDDDGGGIIEDRHIPGVGVLKAILDESKSAIGRRLA